MRPLLVILALAVAWLAAAPADAGPVLLGRSWQGRESSLPGGLPPLRARLDHPHTNRGISNWGEIFDDTTVAAAILDRLLHHGTVLTINGPSYRMHRHHERVESLRAGLQAAPAAGQ